MTCWHIAVLIPWLEIGKWLAGTQIITHCLQLSIAKVQLFVQHSYVPSFPKDGNQIAIFLYSIHTMTTMFLQQLTSLLHPTNKKKLVKGNLDSSIRITSGRR